jgi:AcrR family transcriptional regulator
MDGSLPLLSLRAASKIKTRARVLASAKALFEADGFSAATVRDIAAHASLSTGAIFASFSGKEALFTAAMGKPAPTPAMIDASSDMVDALRQAETFMASFEDDALQDGINERLAAVRAAIAKAEGR